MRNTFSRALLQLARAVPAGYLAAVTFALFLADLLVPDLIPFADELLLALLTLLFGALSKSNGDKRVPVPVTQTRAAQLQPAILARETEPNHGPTLYAPQSDSR